MKHCAILQTAVYNSCLRKVSNIKTVLCNIEIYGINRICDIEKKFKLRNVLTNPKWETMTHTTLRQKPCEVFEFFDL